MDGLQLLGLDLDPIPEEWAKSYEHLKAHREKHDNVDMRGTPRTPTCIIHPQAQNEGVHSSEHESKSCFLCFGLSAQGVHLLAGGAIVL
jgi:hypothetical protein